MTEPWPVPPAAASSAQGVGDVLSGPAGAADDLALLQRYEPILRFTAGEFFFPTDVDQYVRHCGLWVRRPDGKSFELVQEGELEVDRLAAHDFAAPGHTLFLKYIARPLTGLEYTRWLARVERPRFRAPGRLAQVGLGPRLLDALFKLSLLLRGRVPGGTAAAADERYRATTGATPRYVYYGRVVREAGYVVLHYMYFYVMNAWRSAYHGANDHEGDWEQVLVYLAEQPVGPPSPVWVAFAAHDYSGDDVRRRWDDPELARIDEHPVVFVGAGSHAAYAQAGEYLTRIEVAFLKPLGRVLRPLERLARTLLGQANPSLPDAAGPEIDEHRGGLLAVPFIDYARGDGLVIGPGGTATWTAELIDDTVGWVSRYRGLWGYDTKDPFKGESAPSGPKFTREGRLRRSWHDPLGWSGLDKVAPAPQAAAVLEQHLGELEAERSEVAGTIRTQRRRLARVELEVQALAGSAHLTELRAQRLAVLAEQSAALDGLVARQADLTGLIEAGRLHLARLRAGAFGDPQAHLRHKRVPLSTAEIRRGRLIETWAALSSGLLLLGLVAWIGIYQGSWILGVLVLVAAAVVIDAALRRALSPLMLKAVTLLALITAGVLAYEFFWIVLMIALVLLGLLVIADNVRELRAR